MSAKIETVGADCAEEELGKGPAENHAKRVPGIKQGLRRKVSVSKDYGETASRELKWMVLKVAQLMREKEMQGTMMEKFLSRPIEGV